MGSGSLITGRLVLDLGNTFKDVGEEIRRCMELGLA